MTFGVWNTEDTFYVDFGDGQLQTAKVGIDNKGPVKEDGTTGSATKFTGTVAGEGTIKVYGNNDIWYFLVSGKAMPTSLDQAKLMNVVQMGFTGADVESVVLPAYTKMTQFSCNNSPVKSVDVSNVPTLTSLTINCTSASKFEPKLESIDLSKNTELTYLSLQGNQDNYGKLTSLDLTNNTKLAGMGLYVQYNELTEVKLPECALTAVNVQNNQLTSLDVSKLASLKSLYASNNQLAGEMDLSAYSNMEYVQLNNNQLTSVKIGNATKQCWLEGNKLTLATIPAQPSGLSTSGKTKQFKYAPQAALQVAETVTSLDLSAQATVTAGELNSADYATYLTANTTFSFVTAGGATLVEGTDYEVTAPGKFVFLSDQAEKVHAVMLNEAFPKFTAAAPFVTTEFNVAPVKYYVVGNMTEWGVVEDNRMTLNLAADATEYMFTMDLTTSSEFKVVKDGESQTWYPGGTGNNYGQNGEITEDGKYTIYFRPNADGGEDWFNGVIYVAKVVSDDMATAIEAAEALANADAEAIAVGKLQAAIAEAKAIANPIAADVAALQAAVDQFKADNAESAIDLTSKVGTAKDKWTGASGTAGSVTTKAGTTTPLAELYNSSSAGVKMSQTITGLENGLYRVKVFATSHNARGEDGATLNGTATDVTCVFATSGEVTNKTWITASGVTPGFLDGEQTNPYTIEDIEVANGELTIGLTVDKEKQTGWHTIQIYSLEEIATAKAAYAAVKANMTAEIAAAKALKNAYRTEGVEAIDAAIAAAEATLTSNMLNVTEFEAEVATLKAAEAAFKAANYVAINGTFYVQNVASGKFMAAGHSWGTRGIVNATGLDLTLKANENNTVDFDSRVSNGGNSHFLGSNLYMDSSSWGWIIEKAGEDVYTISNGTQFISVDDNDNLVLQDAAATWKFLAAVDVDSERMTAGLAALEAATAENGVDATFLIKANNFNRNDARNAEAWTVSDDCTNKNLGGGCSETEGNGCAESYHSTFTIMQTISGAPAGKYTLTAQGFYRQDTYEGDAPAAPQFFANEVNGDVPVKSGEEGGMADASASFTNGLYTIEPIEFEVKEDGMMYVGITASTNTQWVIWDNFQLTYYGPTAATKYTVAVAETQNGEVKTDKAEAAEGETVTVTVTPAEGFKVDEAYWTTEGSETKNEFTEPEEGNAATFTMPAANVTITVTFKQNQVTPQPAENILYSWESPEGTPVEYGGTIAYVNGDGDRLNYLNSGYYTICLNGKKGNLNDETAGANAGHMVITLDNAVAAGDTIAYTAYVNKNETKKASPYILFENGTAVEGEVFSDEANIDETFGGVPTLKYSIVPEDAAGSKTITLTRSQTGTNLFITKLQVIKYINATNINSIAADRMNGVVYNLNGQKVLKAQKGLYIINGKKVVKK